MQADLRVRARLKERTEMNARKRKKNGVVMIHVGKEEHEHRQQQPSGVKIIPLKGTSSSRAEKMQQIMKLRKQLDTMKRKAQKKGKERKKEKEDLAREFGFDEDSD